MLNTSSLDGYSADNSRGAAGAGNEKIDNNKTAKSKGKSPTKYMQVNVYGYEDYLYRMARYHRMTTTKYLMSLIRKDAEEHQAEYESLKTLSEYDKPHRESPNKKH